jgi:hypothetical protein
VSTFRIELHSHVVYHLDVQADSLDDALAEADVAAAASGEKYLRTGDLLDAWIDDAEAVKDVVL